MKFSGKMCLKIILKVTKKQGFTLSLQDTFFETAEGRGGSNWPTSRFRVKDIGFKYEPPCLWNGCHRLMQKATNFNDAVIVSVKGSAYRTHFWYMSKGDAINIMNNSNLNDKKGVL